MQTAQKYATVGVSLLFMDFLSELYKKYNIDKRLSLSFMLGSVVFTFLIVLDLCILVFLQCDLEEWFKCQDKTQLPTE